MQAVCFATTGFETATNNLRPLPTDHGMQAVCFATNGFETATNNLRQLTTDHGMQAVCFATNGFETVTNNLRQLTTHHGMQAVCFAINGFETVTNNLRLITTDHGLLTIDHGLWPMDFCPRGPTFAAIMSKRIAVIGAGISGVSTALLLAEKGHQLHIISKSFSPNITSNRAAAFWFPYHVRNDKRGIGWCRTAYEYFKAHTGEETGISMKKIIKAVKNNTGDDDGWVDFMPPNQVTLLVNGAAPKGYDKAYQANVPLIETQLFLPWVYKQLEAYNAVFVEQEVTDLQAIANNYDLVINCTALGARTLCNDTAVIPVRGQVVLLEPGFPDFIFLDNQTPAYVVPRKDATIVGGTYEENVYEERTDEESLKDILTRAYSVLEGLDTRKVIGSWAGLRPYRPTVRLERQPGTNIIHNYGHGGSGYTLSFGCAADVVKLVEEAE